MCFPFHCQPGLLEDRWSQVTPASQARSQNIGKHKVVGTLLSETLLGAAHGGADLVQTQLEPAPPLAELAM